MSFTLWFTGLSGAGKTTLSRRVFFEMRRRGLAGELLDGDIIRTNFCQDLGFNRRDRDINVRRIGFIAHLLNKHGICAVVAAISPYADTRAQNRELIGNYHEVFVSCPLEVVEARDVKGLYAKARAGTIPNFTGVSDPYEAPATPEILVDSARETEEQCVARILEYLCANGLIPESGEHAGRCVEDEEQAWRTRLASLGFARIEKR